jgi:hypothetical protein
MAAPAITKFTNLHHVYWSCARQLSTMKLPEKKVAEAGAAGPAT